MIIDVNLDKLKSNKYLSDLFVNAKFNNFNINCNILQGDFYSDSFHYFPITKSNETFSSLYSRTFSNIEHFYKPNFFKNFSTNSFLNSFYSSKFAKNKDKQIDTLNDYLAKFKSDKNLILVTHYVLISEVLNYGPSSGEIVVSDKNFNMIGTIKIDY